MKLLLIVGLYAAHLFAVTHADEFESIAIDIDSGLLPVEAAKRAHDNDVDSTSAVQQLVNARVDVVKAVQTVAKEWSSCEDTYSSVRKGVQISSDRADEIVAAVATIKGCNCNPQSFWARSRLEQRLRPRINRALVEIGSPCSCASAGIEAAIELVPSKTEDMIDAVIIAKNRAERTTDSIGQIGNLPDQKFWGEDFITTKNTNLVRNTEVCKGDHNELDEFNPKDTWGSKNANSDQQIFDYNKALGKHKLLCKEEDEAQTVEEQEENKNEKIIISQYLEGPLSNQALEVYNGSDEPIDLLLNNYQVEVYFHGYDFPGEIIQLKGLVEPQSTFVIADANASADIIAVTNQKVNGLTFKGADAVVLKTGFNFGTCECAVSTVASAINGIDKGNEQKPISDTKKDFIQRIEQHYENTNIQTTIVDSIGRILINDDEITKQKNNQQLDHPIVNNKTLRRNQGTCKGDRIEMDEFSINNEWQIFAPDNFLDSGNFDKISCEASRKDLLLSEYIEGSGNNSMIEIFNGTDRPIDFANERYFLEIYNDNDKNPEQKIYLKGKIERNGVFVITNDNAEDALKDISDQTIGELELKSTRAVVLKRVVLPAYQACYADVANWLEKYEAEEITFILSPVFDPGTGPVTDDDPRDGDDGGELASPN